MPRHENIHLRQLIRLDQLLFRGPLHVAGDEEVMLPRRSQHSEPQFVAPADAHGRKSGQFSVPKGQMGLLGHSLHVHAVPLRQFQQPVQRRAALRFRDRQGLRAHPGQ